MLFVCCCCWLLFWWKKKNVELCATRAKWEIISVGKFLLVIWWMTIKSILKRNKETIEVSRWNGRRQQKLEINGSCRFSFNSYQFSIQFPFVDRVSSTPFLSTQLVSWSLSPFHCSTCNVNISTLKKKSCYLTTHVVRLFSIEQRWKKNFVIVSRNISNPETRKICHYNGTLNSSLCHTPFQ